MILFVDDESRHVDSYIQELRSQPHNYKVEYCDNVDTALEFLESHLNQVDLLILDTIMPTGSAFQDVDTESGLRTGVAFFERARMMRPDLKVIFLTNASDEQERERFNSEERCLYLRKEDYYPFELCTEVEQMLMRWSEGE